MTNQEAIELEERCDSLMSEYLKEDCTVSLALSNRLKINFDNNYITLNKTLDGAYYVRYVGFYEDLAEHIKTAIKCVRDNKEDFDKLIWSYEHIRELE